MTVLAELLTEADAGTWVHEQVGLLMIQDKLSASVAWLIVSERVRAEDPLLLASPGQTWTIRPELVPEGYAVSDCLALEIVERLAEPPQARVRTQYGEQTVIDLRELRDYQLTSWRWQG